MKKPAVILLLSLIVCFAGFAQSTKKSNRVKALIEKIEFRLDSISKNRPYEIIHGDSYYRFKEGVFKVLPDTTTIGSFNMLDRIHFVSKNGEIFFKGIDEKGELFEKTLEQMLFSLENY